jgi:Xaa-Pro aminopeptidase
MIQNRAGKASDLLRECGIDALVLLHPPNIRFLCGFTGSDGVLALTADRDCFLTDSRYATQARGQVVAEEIRQYQLKVDGVIDWLREQGVRRIGFEAETITFSAARRFREKGESDWEWIPVEKTLQALRATKDGEEIAALDEATRLNIEAFEEILPLVRPGTREREIALALEFALKRRGGEEKAFDFIVASGERGALPHGVASDREIRAGELVTIDFGTRINGYHSDETVTMAVGDVSPRLREIYELVLRAHDEAIEAVRPGVSLKEIDAVARDLISAGGYGDFFGHGLGHGVGLEVHEFPTVSPRSEDMAEEGMIFTVEPGIYLPDVGGVRIEDMVQVTADGCLKLTRIPKGFRILPV